MTKDEVKQTRKVIAQLRQQYYEQKFFALVAENDASLADATAQLTKLAVREDALNNIESAIDLLAQLP